jgi:hypothetical protein
LADGSALPTYPSTNLGLLTVDLPPGSHELDLRWVGTGLQRWASLLSLLTMAALVGFTWRVNRPRWLAAIPLGLLILGLTAVLMRPALVEVQPPAQPVASVSSQMLGYRLEQKDSELYIYPYWYTRQTPPAGTVVHWQVRDETGLVVSEAAARPYFNSQQAVNWPPGTLVDDAYQLVLPAGLAAGRYNLFAQVVEGSEAPPWAWVGDVVVASPIRVQPERTASALARYGQSASSLRMAEWQTSEPPNPVLQRLWCSLPEQIYPMDVRFANGMRLIAYSLLPEFVDAGRAEGKIQLSLFWQGDPFDAVVATGESTAKWWNNSVFDIFVHLADGTAVWRTANRPVQQKQFLEGAGIMESIHELAIPPDMPANKAHFEVGLYYYPTSTDERIAVVNQDGEQVGDMVTLGGVMIGEPEPAAMKPDLAVDAVFQDHIELSDLRLEKDLQNGQIVVELGWRALDRPGRDYTAFVHLVDQEQNMVAQSDQPPGGVDNPTHLWAPQEIIHSQFLLQLPAGIDPEGLVLRIGLYDPMSGARLLILDLAEGPATSPDGTYLQLSS